MILSMMGNQFIFLLMKEQGLDLCLKTFIFMDISVLLLSYLQITQLVLLLHFICLMGTCLRRTMMKLTEFLEILEAKTGGFRPISMGMVAQVLAEKKDMDFGLILLKISINTDSGTRSLRQSARLILRKPNDSAFDPALRLAGPTTITGNDTAGADQSWKG
ncbi:hypothetical protein HAX54_024800 [Datura stramonium]|uniref:Uncharacterized protein n=1 Tax=Datura stramonium TaxID=4076 RepID=A0ABS8S5Q7_DATST|nr:hypothetical protein [Datura stramonium]